MILQSHRKNTPPNSLYLTYLYYYWSFFLEKFFNTGLWGENHSKQYKFEKFFLNMGEECALLLVLVTYLVYLCFYQKAL